MPLILGANSSVSGGYNVDNSLRFNSGSDDYLNRTPASAGNRQIWTHSCWVKRTNLTDFPSLLSAGNDGTEYYFLDGNQLQFYYYTSSYVAEIQTTQLFRDVSAWYHIVLSVDTTQATSSNRIKIYVNGSQITTFNTSTYPPQNTNMDINNTTAHYIGRYGTGASGLRNGNYYLAETYLIDGQQLTPSSFGETDEDTGIWIPKAYTGTFGTNGFYLEFKDSSALGDDTSGNNNDFTVNNLTSVDQSTDTPTNNFCTLNFIQNGNGTTSTLTEGNLVAGTADNKGVAANFGVNRGKWFWEVRNAGSQTNQRFGISNRANEQDGDASPGQATASVRSYVALNAFKNYTASSDTSNMSFLGTDGTIFGFALDLDNGTLGRYVNGSLINTDSTLPSDNSTYFFPFTMVTFNNGNWNQAQFNFGSPMYSANSYTDGAGYGNFSYAVPSGYYALCTKNLADYG